MKKSIIAKKSKASLINLLRVKWVLSLLFTLITGVISSQTVNQLNLQISAMLASSDPAMVVEGQHLQSLITDLHPTLAIRNGEFTYFGGNYPIRLECDAASITNLYQPLSAFSGVELIIIKLNNPKELNYQVDLTSLMSFTQLKYIYFLCTFDVCPESNQNHNCVENRLNQMINGTGDGVMMLYKVSIPS